MPPRLAAVAFSLAPLDPEDIGSEGAAVLARLYDEHAEEAEPLADLYRKRHPLLARVLAVAAASVGVPGEAAAPVLYAAPDPADEGPMLRRFWQDVARLEARAEVTWVFHGHADSGVAEAAARSAYLGTVPHADRLLYGEGGLLELGVLFRPVPLAEGDLAALLSVTPPPAEPGRLRYGGGGDPAEAQALAAPLAQAVTARLILAEAAFPYLDRGGRELLTPFLSAPQPSTASLATSGAVARDAGR